MGTRVPMNTVTPLAERPEQINALRCRSRSYADAKWGDCIASVFHLGKQLRCIEDQSKRAEGNTVFRLKRMQHPKSVRGSTVDIAASRRRIDQRQFLQCGNLPVTGEILTTIIGGGAGTQHLDDQRRFALDQAILAVGFTAGRQYIRVKHALSDLQLHVCHLGTAWAAGQILAQGHGHIERDRDVPVLGACHRKHLAINQLMALLLGGFPNQEFIQTHPVEACGISHRNGSGRR
jgi:hypothetical protein